MQAAEGGDWDPPAPEAKHRHSPQGSRQGGLRSHVEEGRVKTVQLERMGLCTGDPWRRGATLGGGVSWAKGGGAARGTRLLRGLWVRGAEEWGDNKGVVGTGFWV